MRHEADHQITHLEDRRRARDLADVLQAMAAAARSGQLPPWLVTSLSPSVSMCHQLIIDYLARQAGARPLPPTVRTFEEILQEMRAKAIEEAAPRRRAWATALMAIATVVFATLACGTIWHAVRP